MKKIENYDNLGKTTTKKSKLGKHWEILNKNYETSWEKTMKTCETKTTKELLEKNKKNCDKTGKRDETS